MLLQRLVAIALERDVDVWGSCLDWNRPSIAFYRSFGACPMKDWTVYRLSWGNALRSPAGRQGSGANGEDRTFSAGWRFGNWLRRLPVLVRMQFVLEAHCCNFVRIGPLFRRMILDWLPTICIAGASAFYVAVNSFCKEYGNRICG